MSRDWRSGVLAGSGYAIVVDGRAILTAENKEILRRMWVRIAEKAGVPVLALSEEMLKQVCYVISPWEHSDA